MALAHFRFSLRAVLLLAGVVTLTAPLTLAEKRAGRDTSSRPEVAKDLYFVAFRSGQTPDHESVVATSGGLVRKRFPKLKTLSARLSAEQVSALERHPLVSYVESVPMRYPQNLSENQLTPALTNGLYGLKTTYAVDVHSLGITGVGVNVGVADTGLDYTHPDIAPVYRGGIDTVGVGDSDPFWNNDPNETHGTHVAGTILAANNSVGVLGVAPNANLYHARVLGPNGGTSDDVMEGVEWLVEMGDCRIINMSLGGGRFSRTENAFYKEMRAQGALVVAASGNNGTDRLPHYPASYHSVTAVGAVDKNNVRADFSNAFRELDVVAPGVGVLSSVPIGTGSEASVTAGSSTFSATGMEFAGKTNGITQLLVNCGLGQPGECPANVAGNIALIQRGSISFAEKVTNAMNAGAVGVIVYNNEPGELVATLGTPTAPGGGAWIPAVGVSDTTGAALLSQVGTPVTLRNAVSNWDKYDGTSMATPHVSGVLALIWAANPALSDTQVLDFLYNTTTDLGEPGIDSIYGRGIVNAAAAVALAQGN